MAEAAENSPTAAASAPEPRADQLQYLTPVPPGFTPEYDYLALLQSLRDTADFATAGSSDSSTPQLLQDLQSTQSHSVDRVCFINSSGTMEWVRSIGSRYKRDTLWMYEQIQSLRRKLVEGKQEDAGVLVADDISYEFLQIIGVAIDLDPAFLWRHYNQDLDSNSYSSEMAALRNRYFSLVTAGRRRRAETNIDQEPSTDEDRNLHMRYGLRSRWSARNQHQISSHISCYYIKANRWLILTRTVASGDFGASWLLPTPFFPDKVLRRSDARDSSCLPLDIGVCMEARGLLVVRPWDSYWYSNIAKESHATFTKVLGLLISKSPPFAKDTKLSGFNISFGERSKPIAPARFGIILGRLLEVSGWEKNIQAFDQHLGKLSTKAMLKASLDTFRPIPILRQNVADLRDALQESSDSVGKTDITAFAELQDVTSHRLESLDTVFDTLLKRTDALSAKVSNEIQLVIGSVTIQDSDTMKRQSRRATLLTLLAAFYLPLTLVTGIFGMNIAEFDVQKPSFILCFEALFAVVAVTAIFYGLYRYLPLVLRTSRKRKARSQKDLSRARRCLLIISAPFGMVYDAFLWLESRRRLPQEDIELTEDGYKLV